MKHQTPLLLALALSLGVAHANNHITELKWSSEGRFVHQAQIKPRAFVEVCGELSAPASVAWTFTASQQLDFNVHYHVGKEVVYPVKPSPLQSGGGTLNVTVHQHYCWMWAHHGPESATLQRAIPVWRCKQSVILRVPDALASTAQLLDRDPHVPAEFLRVWNLLILR